MVYDIWVDFQRMQDDGRLLARTTNVRAGVTLVEGAHVLVGGEDAEPAVALIVAVLASGSIELRVLPGAASEHQKLLQHSC